MTCEEFLKSAQFASIVRKYLGIFKTVGYELEDIEQLVRIKMWEYEQKGQDTSKCLTRMVRCDLVDLLRVLTKSRCEGEKAQFVNSTDLTEYQSFITNNSICMPDESIDVKEEVEYRLRIFSSRTRKILKMYFMDGITMKKIGERLNICESRVSQIIKKAKMRGFLMDLGY